MNETINKAVEWVKANVLLSVGILFGIVLIFFPKIFRSATRRRRRRPVTTVTRRRRMSPVRRKTKRTYSKGGSKKKPWQIKGSLAAKRYMARIRRKR